MVTQRIANPCTPVRFRYSPPYSLIPIFILTFVANKDFLVLSLYETLYCAKCGSKLLKYRPELDGLRALAVLSVILFHAEFEIFSGGFVGVDVFFVISGYLITTILIYDIENKRFSIVNFYERRARRILPALFFVMLVCIPFAWIWMLPDPFENFGQSIVATTLSGNNILLFL